MTIDRHEEPVTDTVHPPEQSQSADLSKRVENWLEDTRRLTKAFDLQSMSSELEKIVEMQRLSGFRVTFVGEFSRGKSTLINRLLHLTLLPVKVLPTTATISHLVAGEPEGMAVRFQNGRQETRPLEAASWQDLIATNDASPDQTQEMFPDVYVTLNNPWLRDLDAEIIDTPGAGDIDDHRTALISDVLSQSDVAVMLVSAVLPLSLTERAFLEQEVLGRHIPLVMVVVSMLDQISYDQRLTVFEAIRDRVESISPKIVVVPSYPLDEGITDFTALDAVRLQIHELVVYADRGFWRDWQTAGMLADYLARLVHLGQTALVTAQMDADKREEERRKARKKEAAIASRWETIHLDLESRRLTLDQELRRRISMAAAPLHVVLSEQIASVRDPKLWWEREFSLNLRRELISLARASESFIVDALARDIEGVKAAVFKTFGVQVSQASGPLSASVEIHPRVQNLSLSDIQNYRLLSLLGSGVGVVAGYLLLGPIGSAVGATVGLVGQYVQDQRLEEQRQRLREEMVRSVDRTLEEYTRLLTERLRTLYDELERRMREEQGRWQRAEEIALAEGENASAINWQELVEKSLVVRNEILTFLAQ